MIVLLNQLFSQWVSRVWCLTVEHLQCWLSWRYLLNSTQLKFICTTQLITMNHSRVHKMKNNKHKKWSVLRPRCLPVNVKTRWYLRDCKCFVLRWLTAELMNFMCLVLIALYCCWPEVLCVTYDAIHSICLFMCIFSLHAVELAVYMSSFIRHNMTGQQGIECTKSCPTKCNKIRDIKTIIYKT